MANAIVNPQIPGSLSNGLFVVNSNNCAGKANQTTYRFNSCVVDSLNTPYFLPAYPIKIMANIGNITLNTINKRYSFKD